MTGRQWVGRWVAALGRTGRRRVSAALRASAMVLVVTAGSGCRPQRGPEDPQDVLHAYARALNDGRTADAYALLSDEARRGIPFEAFERMVRENSSEVREIAAALLRPAGAPLVTATVTTPAGETLLLVYEGDEWRVDGSAVDLYSQSTPETAVRSFVRAYENRRWDVLLRFVPASEAHGLTEATLRAAWEGEQKQELERLTQALKASLPSARVERTGERATMAYGAGGTVEMVRETGAWKIEDFR